MADIQDFVGIWRSERGTPYSTQTFTWTTTDDGLRGAWVIEATAPPPGAGSWMSNPKPRRHDMVVGPPTVEDGRALFTLNGGPYITEFLLLGNGEALVGAALDKIPPEFSGPEFARSIEGHRIRLRRSEPSSPA
jgi:hypothetical protein